MTEELPPLPRLQLKKQLKLYRKLFDRLWRYRRQMLGADQLRHVGRACAAIIGVRVPELHVQDTLVQYAGATLTATLCDQLARQLSARVDDLEVSPLLRTSKIAGEGWHLLEIYTLMAQEKFGKPGRATRLYVVAGQLAGQYLTPWLNENLLSYLAYQALGFSRKTIYEYEPQLLIGLRCWAYLRENEEQTEIVGWAKDALTDKHNKPILKLRLRFDVDIDSLSEKLAQQYACPSGYDHYCHSCQITASTCVASSLREHLLGYAEDHQSGRGTGGAANTSPPAQCSTGSPAEV